MNITASVDGGDLVALAALLLSAITIVSGRRTVYRERLYDQRVAAALELAGKASGLYWGVLDHLKALTEPDMDRKRLTRATLDQSVTVTRDAIANWQPVLPRRTVEKLTQFVDVARDEECTHPKLHEASVAYTDALRDMIGVDPLGKELEALLPSTGGERRENPVPRD